jgi:hypothetical protein
MSPKFSGDGSGESLNSSPGGEMPQLPVWLCGLSLLATGLIIAVGTAWAFQRGGRDFDVFHHAWRLVLEDRGTEIYVNNPDRFLYAPGFGWLLSPLGYFPRDLGLAIWCFAKAAVIGFVVRELGRRLSPHLPTALAIGALGVAMLARPLLVDFQYGQVNVFILGGCVWALLSHFHREEVGLWDALPWFALSFLAVAKVFAIPLLAVPWLLKGPSRRKLAIERAGVAAGLALIVFAPAWTLGWEGNLQILRSWGDALLAKGLPLETHNQSFVAAVIRLLSGEPSHVIFKGSQWVVLGWSALGPEQLKFLGLAWTCIWTGVIAAWLLAAPSRWPALHWASALIGMLILPAHLIWKPYFIMGLPAAILCVAQGARAHAQGKLVYPLALGVIFLAINFSGYNFLPDWPAAILEGISLMLWTHLALIALSSPSKLLRAS